MPDYTTEQIADTISREKKALEVLKELQLSPAASVKKVIIGNSNGQDIFADMFIPFLQDTKYAKDAPQTQDADIKAIPDVTSPDVDSPAV